MSTPRSSTEVEHLLRRTYAAVAERTAVSPASNVDEVQLSPSVPTVRRAPSARLVASAAAFVVLVGGLLALTGRDGAQPAGRDVSTRILPGLVPNDGPLDGSGDWRPFALTELRTDPDRDRVTYSWYAASISLELDRTRRSLPDGEAVTIRGTQGRRTDSTLSWLGPDGALVEVSWSGEVVDDQIDSFVQGILYVDDDTWLEAAGTGGFRPQSTDEAIATVRIDAEVPFDVELLGNLHEGLAVWLGSSGFIIGGPNIECRPVYNDLTSDPESNRIGYAVLAGGDVVAAVVRAIGDDEQRIEMTSLLPLADLSIGGVVYENRRSSSPLPRVDCEDTP